MHRRTFNKALIGGGAAGLLPGIGYSQDASGAYPTKPIKFIVPYAAGGQPDSVARALIGRVSELLGKPVVVDNRAGGSGVVAYSGLMQSTPTDGHAFICSDGAMLSIAPHVTKAATFRFNKDLLPVALIGRSALYVVAHQKTGITTLKDFVAAVRAKPGQYNYGSSGVGSNHHLTMEALKAALKLDIRHIPFRGSSQSIPALVGGQVDFSIAALPSVAGFVQSGQLKLLASNAATRSPLTPDIPPIADVVPGFDYATILTVLAAAGTPAIAIQRMSQSVIEAIKNPDVIKGLHLAGVEPLGGGPAELTKALNHEIEVMARAAQVAQLTAE